MRHRQQKSGIASRFGVTTKAREGQQTGPEREK
jgi:hypothetical protein